MTMQSKIMGALALAAAVTLSSMDRAAGQNQPLAHDGDTSSHLLDRPYLAPTGAVVAKPGRSQSGGATAQDRKAQQQDDKITNSICSNC
ncbi:hypothetical protein [Methylovirgula sp. HY1]|uniref:hypothetical protein n=1 Tax=Methylovirgula sp. HY1 TaxID=2822761 RepID=UPI001C5A5F49|nr:hypothetical protein [Methylovirgula sp. HY1]QXX76348.1 hypothetical protein MHY1_03188 [Methylovirgula sp. HY1]